MNTVFLLFLAIVAISALLSSVRIVRQYEKGVILRLGTYRLTVSSGVAFIMPFIEEIITVDMREKVISVEPQKVITKDNVSVIVDAVIYYKVVDPVRAKFEVEDFGMAATILAQTNLRNLIGDKTLDETLVARNIINTNLREVLDEATNNWGVKVTRVEVQKIDPPEDITNAMSQQMKAEREKRASILQSEGLRQSQILEAEGQRQGAILKAEGEAKATILKAQAEAEAIKQVAESANKFFDEKAQKWRRMEVSEKVLANNAKFILPTGGEIVNVLNLEGESKVIPVASKR